TSIPFDEETDPKRVLANLANKHWFHGADNEVVYYHFIPDASPINRYHPVAPVRFRIGDIVEAQMSCVVVPLKGEKFKMIHQLHLLALLDATYTQVCF
ncbi:hypothetical protein PILCRDRAFT_75994, partial [Piloderma croceum F 1598]